MSPRRHQLSRKPGYRKPEDAIVVSRPSRWGNPFTVSDAIEHGYAQSVAHARRVCAAGFRDWLLREYADGFDPDRRHWILDHLPELAGHDLACWCPLPAEGETDWCHAAVLIEIANDPAHLPANPNGEH